MSIPSFAHEIRPGQDHSDTDGRSTALVTGVSNSYPPTLLLDDDREIPFLGNVWDYNPGDVVYYHSRGAGSVVQGKLARRGVSAPTEDPDEAVEMDTWHEVGAGGEPAFANSWVNYAGVNDYDTAGFYMQPDYWVRLKGLIKDGSMGNPAFALPQGYRPHWNMHFSIWTQGGTAYLLVDRNGGVTPMTGGSNVAVSLSGITFPTRVNESAWIAPLESGDWNGNATYADSAPAVFVRDDGWCYVKGAVNSAGGTASNVFYTPERARSRFAEVMPAIGLGTARIDHGGDSGYRGQSRFYGVTGGTSLIVGGLNWYSNAGPLLYFEDMSPSNGWVEMGSDHRELQYYRDHYNVVHLMGVLSGAGKSSNVFQTMPAGYRPAKRQVFHALFGSGASDIMGRIDVYPDGTLEAFSGTTGYASLATVTYRADM